MATRLFSRPYSLLALAFLVGLAIPSFLRKSQDWETVYIPAAARLASGDDIYQNDFVYPPINAWLPLPFVEMPHVPARGLWFAINMTALAILLWGAWSLSGGGRLEGEPRVARSEHAIFWLGAGCGISSCLDAITNQQTDLIVAALCILGCLALVQARDWRASLWFGIAASIKCTPLLWAGYLAWQRRWVSAGLVVVVAVGINVIPDLTHPRATGEGRAEEWTRRFLMPMAERKHDFGEWHCGVGGNQSVAGLWHRWLAYDAVWDGPNLLGVSSEARVAPETLKAVTWGSMLLLLGAGLACSWKARAQPPVGMERVSFEFGMMLILMVLLSPHSSKPHFCTLLLPGFCVARAAALNRDRMLLGMLVAALMGAVVSNKDLVGEWIYSWTKWYGALAWCAVLLYAGSCRVLLGQREAAVAPAEQWQPVEAVELRQAA